jgi:hypothetical protein
VKKRKENDIIDIKIYDEKDEKPKEKVEFVEPKLERRLPGPATIKGLGPGACSRPSTPAARIKPQITPLYAEPESSFQARYRSSNNASITQSNNENVFELTGITLVARFLNACSPPMGHFLQAFMDFGCTSEEYLVAISTWRTDGISYFLKQVVSHGSDKHQFSQMDILILQNHFISYFNKAST